MRWGLADALDLMVISVEAGLGLNAAMMKVSTELKEVHPDICDEFELANLEIRVGRDVKRPAQSGRAHRRRRSAQPGGDADSDRQVWYLDR